MRGIYDEGSSGAAVIRKNKINGSTILNQWSPGNLSRSE